MLIRFGVENYRSFLSRQVFSMVAGSGTNHPSHLQLNEGVRLLKSSIFFGANASGKSNFIRSLNFMKKTVLSGTKNRDYGDQGFRLSPSSKDLPGVFQAEFISNHRIYSYGFAINYKTYAIEAEWLYRLFTQEPNEICIFNREKGQKITTDLELNDKAHTRFKIYSEDLKDDELFLKFVGDRVFPHPSLFVDFQNTYNWFKHIIIVYPHSHPASSNDYFLKTSNESKTLAKMLRIFDTGISDVKSKKQSAEKELAFLPEKTREDILSDMLRNANEPLRNGYSVKLRLPDQNELSISLEDGKLIAEKMMLCHDDESELFEQAEESDGTRRLFDLLPLYEIGKEDRVIVIDELDRSLHSKLTENYLHFFYEVTKNSRSQLICTTHDLNLMDTQLLRQDEIWFIEREKDHSTKLYSLSDYRHDPNRNLRKDYLIGRYGAIPCISQIEAEDDE